ncbi:L-asparaginase [Lamellibrachia satsuma]|nr:L-asparaginase [Lamellibrachia satsuma]
MKRDDRVIIVAEKAHELTLRFTASTKPLLLHQHTFLKSRSYLNNKTSLISIIAQCFANDSVQRKQLMGTWRGCLSQQPWMFPIQCLLLLPTLTSCQSTEGRRIIYCVYEYDPLLDSSNMTVDDYAQLALDIKANYGHFDGFVILHGTDTMSYTASALSFMLENLGKPVILTGSQIPIFETRSDGRDNFLGALIMAGHYVIPEVTIYFHNTLLRGNRSTKNNAGSLDAFCTPNLSPLAEMKVNIHVNWNAVFRQSGIKKCVVHSDMCRDVGVLRIFPSITLNTVKQFLMPPMKGVVLQSYGAGNGPSTRQDIMDVLREASDRGMLIVNITQCSRGMVTTSYESGKALLDSGVIPGSDMTVEAALMKLAYILSKNEWPLERKRKMVSVNLRGELTVTVEEEKDLLEHSLIQKMAETMKISSAEEVKLLRDAIFPSLLCSAARQGNIDMLKELREAGADLSLGNSDGRTVLHIATCEGHIELVRYVLEYGASVHMRDRYGHSPLDDAIFFHRNDIIKLLRDTGAHLRLAPTRLGMMLCNSVVQEDVARIESWCLAGVNLNQGDYDRRTALHLAASLGCEDMVKFLLEHGADPHGKDAFGQTPIDEARKNNHTNVLKLLGEANPSSDT